MHTDLKLWPRSAGKAPEGYQLCGCLGCENKTFSDHILKDYEDEDDPPSGNYHLEEVYIPSDHEK